MYRPPLFAAIAATGLTAAAMAAGGYLLTPAPAPAHPVLSAAAASKLARADAEIAFLQRRVVRQPDDTEGLRTLAHAWTARGKLSGDGHDFAEANRTLNLAEAQEPGSLRFLNERVRILEAGHRFVSARQLAEAGLKRSPDDGDLLGLAGDSALYSGDLPAAEHYYRRFTEAAPKAPSAVIGLSFWAELSGDLEQAVDLMQKAPTVSYPMPLSGEREAYVHAVLGEIRSKQGELAEARRQFGITLQMMPGNAIAASGLSDLEQWEGHDEAAAHLLQGLIDNEAPNADYQVKLADIRDRQGDHATATHLRDAAERFYAWSIASGDNGYLRPLATLKLAAGDFAAAAVLAARDLPERPSAESRTIYRNILSAARAAGHPVAQALLPGPASSPLKLASNP